MRCLGEGQEGPLEPRRDRVGWRGRSGADGASGCRSGRVALLPRKGRRRAEGRVGREGPEKDRLERRRHQERPVERTPRPRDTGKDRTILMVRGSPAGRVRSEDWVRSAAPVRQGLIPSF